MIQMIICSYPVSLFSFVKFSASTIQSPAPASLQFPDQNKRMNEHVGILQKKLCIFTKVYFSNSLYLTSKIVYTMPEMNQIIV